MFKHAAEQERRSSSRIPARIRRSSFAKWQQRNACGAEREGDNAALTKLGDLPTPCRSASAADTWAEAQRIFDRAGYRADRHFPRPLPHRRSLHRGLHAQTARLSRTARSWRIPRDSPAVMAGPPDSRRVRPRPPRPPSAEPARPGCALRVWRHTAASSRAHSHPVASGRAHPAWSRRC